MTLPHEVLIYCDFGRSEAVTPLAPSLERVLQLHHGYHGYDKDNSNILDLERASDKGNSHKRFVEARTNQKFAVRVTLLPGFDFEYALGVYGRVTLDDATAFSYLTMEKGKGGRKESGRSG
jgi:hypothetical protein